MQRANFEGEDLMAANWLCDELGIPAGFSDRDIMAQAIRAEARERGSVELAAKFIKERAIIDRKDGRRINRFWFTDQRYLEPQIKQAGADNQRKITEDEAHAIWQSMPEKYREENPWSSKL